MAGVVFDYEFKGTKRPAAPSPPGAFDPEPAPRRGRLKGQRCRVLAKGECGTAVVEFEDGYMTTTARSALRHIKRKPHTGEEVSDGDEE